MIGLALIGLAVAAAVMIATWVVSVRRRDASVVDPVWGLVIVTIAVAYAACGGRGDARQWITLTLAAAWGLRLFAYLAWRRRGEPEDRRYREMREKRPDAFARRSLVTVFGLQAVLSWIVAMPLLAAVHDPHPPAFTPLDVAGMALVAAGLAFEWTGDAQLARFKADPANEGRVMDRGLWRYTRHPNYFGEFLVWWGFGALALATGAWWALVSPLLMSALLMRFSGVGLLERHMSTRPGYAEYAARTNAFFPGPARSA